MHKKVVSISFFISILMLLNACSVSFSGISISPDVKTISIENFVNESGSMPVQTGQQFAEALRTYYLQNTRLKIVSSGGDLQITGRVTGYNQTPIAPTAGSTAAKTRQTIAVNLTFINTKDSKQSFNDQTFSQFEDFDQSKSLTEIEAEINKVIFGKLQQDIFNKTVTNW